MLRKLFIFIFLMLALYFLSLGNLGAAILLTIFVALLALIKKEEYTAEKKQEEAKQKLEETLDNRYPEVFYSSSVLLSDPKWAPAVKFGDAFMLDLLHHLMFKVREIDKGIQSGEIKGPEKGGFYGSSKPEGTPFMDFVKGVAQSYKESTPEIFKRGEVKKEETKEKESKQENQSQASSQQSSSSDKSSENESQARDNQTTKGES